MERWRLIVVGYLVWLMAFAVVDGLGREACRMPTARWIAAGADARERALRDTFRDRATACLEETRWYVYSSRALVLAGLVLPLGALWLVPRRRELVRGLTLAAALAATLASIELVRWLYDWMS